MKKLVLDKIISLVLLQLTVVSMADARIVKGRVSCGREKLENVVVTDGKSFATTNARGRYEIDIREEADFIYIVTPEGYTAPFESGVPVFFKEITAQDRYDFELLRTEDSKDYSLIAMADPQTANEEHFALFQKKVMPDLLKTVSTQKQNFANTYGIVLGDIVWDNMDLMPEFKKEFVRTGIPVYPVIGNHDYVRQAKGDHDTAMGYRECFGPENYAFCMGGDYMIVLDNILYDTQKHYVETLTDDQLEWVEHLLEYIPEDAHIWVSMHCPIRRWFSEDRPWLGKGQNLLRLLEGREYTVLTGHTHINNINVLDAEKDRLEHNIATACGTWWSTDHCSDGTPGGYKVFEKKDGKITWHYQSLGKEKDFQMEVFTPGESERHPNAVIANVWDYDPQWKVEWFQDGKPMGQMEQVLEISPYFIRELNAVYGDKGKKTPRFKMPRQNNHYFMAVPSQYAKEVEVVVTDRFGHQYRETVPVQGHMDVQAHRGGAGLMPENTLEAMKNALDMGVNTLEFDFQITKDGKVILNHEQYFDERYTTRPDGTLVEEDDPKEYFYHMTYEEIRKYDVGLRPNTVWPDQAHFPAHKMLASDLIDFVEEYTAEHGLTPVRYNIEIKSRAGGQEGKDWPDYHEFVDICLPLLESKNLGDRLVVQSFDPRALNYLHQKNPDLILSYVVRPAGLEFDEYMALLDFAPQWLEPRHNMVDAELCRKVHDRGMKMVTWTVDTPEEMQRMIDLGVDAVITNYPDRLLKLTRGYVSSKHIVMKK